MGRLGGMEGPAVPLPHRSCRPPQNHCLTTEECSDGIRKEWHFTFKAVFHSMESKTKMENPQLGSVAEGKCLVVPLWQRHFLVYRTNDRKLYLIIHIKGEHHY